MTTCIWNLSFGVLCIWNFALLIIFAWVLVITAVFTGLYLSHRDRKRDNDDKI